MQYIEVSEYRQESAGVRTVAIPLATLPSGPFAVAYEYDPAAAGLVEKPVSIQEVVR